VTTTPGGILLLDVNLLIALFDPDHVHHDLAHDWFEDNRGRGWATCPLTENGFVRVVAHPKYTDGTERVEVLVDRLRRFCASRDHQFWPAAVTLTAPALFHAAFLTSYKQLTDIYLLGLAKSMSGRLATFDRSIPWKAVVGGSPELLEVISPVP
jgi:toxin-antitoxin system PIN domain toxin